jgi:hypothetical protein
MRGGYTYNKRRQGSRRMSRRASRGRGVTRRLNRR